MCVSGGKKCSIYGKFKVLCFLVKSGLKFALSLITDALQCFKVDSRQRLACWGWTIWPLARVKLGRQASCERTWMILNMNLKTITCHSVCISKTRIQWKEIAFTHFLVLRREGHAKVFMFYVVFLTLLKIVCMFFALGKIPAANIWKTSSKKCIFSK